MITNHTYYDAVHSEIQKENDATFGVWCGFLNKTLGTKLSVKEARGNLELVQMYEGMREVLKELHIAIPARKSTRRSSLDNLDIPKLDSEVLVFIYNHDCVSRKMIADGLGRRLSSVCGAVKRLLDLGELVVCQERGFDSETKQQVELLAVRKI